MGISVNQIFLQVPFGSRRQITELFFKKMKSVLFQSFSKMKLDPALKIIGPVKFYEIRIFLFLTSPSINLGASKIEVLVFPRILVNRNSSVRVASRTHSVRLQLSSRQTVFQFVQFRFFVSLDVFSFLFWCLSAFFLGWVFCTLRLWASLYLNSCFYCWGCGGQQNLYDQHLSTVQGQNGWIPVDHTFSALQATRRHHRCYSALS